MNAIQRRAYEAPIDEEKAPPGSLNPGENNHAEVANGIQVSVVLTADVSRFGAEQVGRRGQWHVSVAVWPGKPGPPARPIPTAHWTPMQKAAAERVAKRNLELCRGVDPQFGDGPHGTQQGLLACLGRPGGTTEFAIGLLSRGNVAP
jgi:hypothetical protein